MDSKPVLWEDAPELAVHRVSELELDTFGGSKGVLRLLVSFVLFCIGGAVAVKVSLDARDARRASRAALSPAALSANVSSGWVATASNAQATSSAAARTEATGAEGESAQGAGAQGVGAEAERAERKGVETETTNTDAAPETDAHAAAPANSKPAETAEPAPSAQTERSEPNAFAARATPEPAPAAMESAVPTKPEASARGSNTEANAERRSPKPGALDRQKLASSLAQAAQAAKACAGTGTARVLVTFAPLGYVRSVDFEVQPAPREARACVLAAFTRARIPPFSGDPVTARKTFSF